MATRLHGILLDGLNKPIINATVALIAKGNTITVLNGSEAIFRTDGEGAYNVTVQTGHYKVIIGPQGIEPYKAGEIVIYGDSPEGSLNGYLINWAPEQLTPDVIKQVQRLVANSEEYALQAGRSAAAANADATDARNSKAAAATSASQALTYKNDSKANADAAKQAQAGAAGSANTATQAVTTITNLKKDVEKLKSNTQTIKNNAVSETQAIKDAAVSETTALKDAAAASATEAGNSATEAGKQAGNASTSATAAKNDADRAKTEADRAESAANNAPEIQPLPDVWIPFNDSLDMITGFSPSYKKIVIDDDEITMPGDKIVKFKRASKATYINKSGVLTEAAIDEPRFEKYGLLIEGQRTNLLINSTNPSKWNKSSNMILNTSGVDDFGFQYAKFTLKPEMVGQTSSLSIVTVSGSKGYDVTGDEKYVTISCRVQSGTPNLRCRLRFEEYDGSTHKFVGDAFLNMTDLSIDKTGGDASRITARAVKNEASKWIFFEATIKALDTENMIGAMVQYAPPKGGSTGADDYIYVATPQLEGGSCASSFIITEETPVTRASDMVNIPTNNNIGTPPLTFLAEVHTNWNETPNAAPRIFDTSGGSTTPGQYISVAISSTLFPSVTMYNKDGSTVVAVSPVLFEQKSVLGFVLNESGNVHFVSNAQHGTPKTTDHVGVKSGYFFRIGGQNNSGLRHLFGHIRNFRIWHKELTDRQMKESV